MLFEAHVEGCCTIKNNKVFLLRMQTCHNKYSIYCPLKYIRCILLHCTMRLSIELENFQILKSKGLVFAQFWSKYDNSSADWWKTGQNLKERYTVVSHVGGRPFWMKNFKCIFLVSLASLGAERSGKIDFRTPEAQKTEKMLSQMGSYVHFTV